ncbi:MAG: ATP-binding protein [Bacteroidales bacterium]|nr:ATP-binding protein [Bacteroidales bacterium]
MIDFIPLIIDLLNGDKVFLIDEMERSLHPNLFYDLMDLFLSKCANFNSQLIVASHESTLLTQKLFRKTRYGLLSKIRKDQATYIHLKIITYDSIKK